MRRTSHIDIAFVGDGLELRGAARDLLTDEAGVARVTGAASVVASLDAARTLTQLDTTPSVDATALHGLPVASGFRAAVDRLLPDERTASTPLYLLLDELPVAALISGYAMLYLGTVPAHRHGEGPALKSDICAGWRHDGTMMVAFRQVGQIPVPLGPAAPELAPADDLDAWHAIPLLPSGAMRRRRMVEVAWGRPAPVVAMFRDTHVGPDGTETVLHEYSYEGAVDPDTLVVVASQATPRVLPWVECPQAAASATRLVGRSVADLRQLVKTELKGTSTCTHLNDLLRSLADVGPLLSELASEGVADYRPDSVG